MTDEFKEAKPVIINWLDCSYNSGTTYYRKELSAFKLANVFTIGWGIEEENRWVLYDECYPDDETHRQIIAIPKSGIVKITYLQELLK